MSHGFSRFGPPPAREQLHRQMRGAGTISMLLPTIVATLFMFTVVITLNKASSLTRGGKIVRLMNVDDVFPTPESVEQNRKKEFWELTVPPPSPDAVLEARDAQAPPVLEEPARAVISSPASRPTPASRTAPVPGRTLSIDTPDIKLPAIAPDTSVPVATPTP